MSEHVSHTSYKQPLEPVSHGVLIRITFSASSKQNGDLTGYSLFHKLRIQNVSSFSVP